MNKVCLHMSPGQKTTKRKQTKSEKNKEKFWLNFKIFVQNNSLKVLKRVLFAARVNLFLTPLKSLEWQGKWTE